MANVKTAIVAGIAGVLMLGCASAAPSIPTTAPVEPTPTVAPQPTPEPTATPTVIPKVNPRATKEYLLSLPLMERQRLMMLEGMKKEDELSRKRGLQVTSWIEENTVLCKHHFGTHNCEPYVLEMEKEGPCGWQAFQRVPWELGEELDDNLAYLVFLGTDQADIAGDMFFYTTPETRGSMVSLDTVRCWQQIGRFPKRASLN